MKILVENHQNSPSSLIKFFSVSSIASIIKDILLQKSRELKKEGRKSFT